MEERKFDKNSLIGFLLIGGILLWMLYINQPEETPVDPTTTEAVTEADSDKENPSEVDFGDEATYEMDLFLGYELMVSDKFSLDVGVIQYNWDKGYDDVEEMFAKVNLKNVSVAYYVDMDDSEKDYMEMSVSLPFVKFMDVSVDYGMFDSENDFWALSMSKSMGNWDMVFYMTEDAKQDQFMDNASLGLFYNF